MQREQISRKLRQSFHYAGLRHATRLRAGTRVPPAKAAVSSILKSIASFDFEANALSHEPRCAPIQKSNCLDQARKAGRRDASLRAGTHIHIARRPRPAPRGTRPLARQADGAPGLRSAQEKACFERHLKTGGRL